MPLHFASCLRRLLVALLCVQIVVCAAGATGAPAVGAIAARMPSGPNFQPPSATGCARPVQTEEIPGMRSAEPGTRSAERVESLDRGEFFIGSTIADLRGLDPAFGTRTLTMVDGRRIVAAPPAAPAPLASVSEALTEATVTGTRILTPGATSANGRPAGEPVTAGMVDDNADFSEYLGFRSRTQVPHRELDISMRYLLQVRDARGAVVPDAEVVVQAPGGAAMWARTDAGGRAWLHPLAFDTSNSQMYEVTVRKNGRQGTAFLKRGQKSAVDVVIKDPGTRPARARLDLVFLIDATGSMGDEIAKLKSTLRTIADEVAQLPSHPDTCFGLVAYRDTTDEFLVRRHDFTNDLEAFQGVLNALQAGGGGDYAEAMNEALAETVHGLSWRGTDTTRLVVLLADAPPHLDYDSPQYDDSMIAALGKGIKVFSVGASGLDKQGEFIQRQIAQYTGGRFVFLTYRNAANPASGPGRETVHDVNDYSVQTLDRLVVRLVSEELERLPRGR